MDVTVTPSRPALGEVDRLLWQLEELAEAEVDALSPKLARSLANAGVADPRHHSVPELHELVLDLQAPLTARPPNCGSVTPRGEARSRFHAGDLVAGYSIV